MRVSVSIFSAVAILAGATSASAMDANEIFSRLKAQAGASEVVQGSGGATRGLAVSYGEPEETAAAPEPSVVSVPAPAVQAASVGTSQSDPVPVYTMTETAPESTTVTFAQPTAVTPAYQTQTPASVSTQTMIESAPTVQAFASPEPLATTPVAVRPVAQSYSSVDDAQRVDLRIFFEWNSASLKPEAIGQLAELCTAIRRVGASPDNRFKIIGHTDKSGSEEYNLYLSNARAREVKRHLVEECALPASALIAVGEGERQSRPDTPSNAPEERRVEIQFVS